MASTAKTSEQRARAQWLKAAKRDEAEARATSVQRAKERRVYFASAGRR
jgi:hypothetical protein